jgi:hypothetical protein
MTTPNELRAEAARLNAQAQELESPITESDIKQMFKERRYEEIVAANEQGRLDSLYGTTEGK